jgi:hypothetical protein
MHSVTRQQRFVFFQASVRTSSNTRTRRASLMSRCSAVRTRLVVLPQWRYNLGNKCRPTIERRQKKRHFLARAGFRGRSLVCGRVRERSVGKRSDISWRELGSADGRWYAEGCGSVSCRYVVAGICRGDKRFLGLRTYVRLGAVLFASTWSAAFCYAASSPSSRLRSARDCQ